MKIKSPLLFLFLLPFSLAFSQSQKATQIEDADEHFKNGNYLMAIPIYKAELKKEPNDSKIKFRLGICYVKTRLNREEAVVCLEQASKDPKIDEDVWIQLGRAYFLYNRIEEAQNAFDHFESLKPKRAQEIERDVEYCDNAVKLMRKPSNVSFQNLGKDINSPDADYLPFIDADENFLIFTSRRKENNIGGKKVEMDGYRSSDVFQSTLEHGNWTPAKNAGRGINTNLDEQAVGLRSDGLVMYVYLDHIDKFGDIYISTRKDHTSEFAKPAIIDPVVNSKIETSGCLSEDGDLLVFARREKISNTSDLFMSRKLPNGKWGLPQKLPETINSPFNEDQPFLS